MVVLNTSHNWNAQNPLKQCEKLHDIAVFLSPLYGSRIEETALVKMSTVESQCTLFPGNTIGVLLSNCLQPCTLTLTTIIALVQTIQETEITKYEVSISTKCIVVSRKKVCGKTADMFKTNDQLFIYIKTGNLLLETSRKILLIRALFQYYLSFLRSLGS